MFRMVGLGQGLVLMLLLVFAVWCVATATVFAGPLVMDLYLVLLLLALLLWLVFTVVVGRGGDVGVHDVVCLFPLLSASS